MNIFFVCGAPKSGTTWLQRILDVHPEISCSGEGHFISRFSGPMARVINTYNRGLAMEREQVYEGRPYYEDIDQDEFDEMVRGFVLSRLRARADANIRWLGDKTPNYTAHLHQLNRLFPQARIIHIVRDPRDVAVSRMAHSHRAGYVDAFTPGTENHRQTVADAVRLWIDAVTKVDTFAQDRPGLVHEVGYRDLHHDPIATTTELFRFLGAAADPVIVEQVAAATSFEAMAGRKPGEEDISSFLRKGVVGDWKARLDAESARLISENCGDLMRRKRLAA